MIGVKLEENSLISPADLAAAMGKTRTQICRFMQRRGVKLKMGFYLSNEILDKKRIGGNNRHSIHSHKNKRHDS